MSEQREIPTPADALAWLAIQQAKRGGHYGGGRIENFREGWGLVGFGKAHYLRLELGKFLVAACGPVWEVNPRTPVFAPGKWPRCLNCSRICTRS